MHGRRPTIQPRVCRIVHSVGVELDAKGDKRKASNTTSQIKSLFFSWTATFSTSKQQRHPKFVIPVLAITVLCAVICMHSFRPQESLRYLAASGYNGFIPNDDEGTTTSKKYEHIKPSDAHAVKPSIRSTTIDLKDSKANTKEIVGGAMCISPRKYGRAFNRILTLANALAMIADNATALSTAHNTDTPIQTETFIGLPPFFSIWYDSFLDPRPDIVLNYTGPCLSTWDSKDIFLHKDYRFQTKSRQQLQQLLPKRSFRIEAEHALAAYSKNGQQQVITVHRRHLEGICIRKASLPTVVAVACNNPKAKNLLQRNDLIDICNYEYSMVKKDHSISIENNTSVVVLCTDQQVPELDATFPIQSNYSFPVEAWMMTKSDIHYGNPYSTVDLVVSSWRTGQGRTTHPHFCYEV
jgi:hypothetical protein